MKAARFDKGSYGFLKLVILTQEEAVARPIVRLLDQVTYMHGYVQALKPLHLLPAIRHWHAENHQRGPSYPEGWARAKKIFKVGRALEARL